MKFDTIAFDADDTLWHSETHYHETQDAFVGLLAPYGIDREKALGTLHRIEIANLTTFGYGIKGFTLSMIEAAIEATAGKVGAGDIQAVVDLGRAMTEAEVSLLEHSAAAVAQLAATHPLMLVTKGDLMDQERKITASGLASYFRHIEIVSDKSPETYATVLAKHRLAPQRFMMIGNSMRSDILPVLAIGGWAVYVPYALTWAHESAESPTMNHRYFEIGNLGQLPDLVATIEDRD